MSRLRWLRALPVLALALFSPVPAAAGLDLEGSNWTLGGVPCRLIEVPSASPVGTGPCGGVRPGAVVLTPRGLCTFNFLFDGSDGRRYMGTAGHCILGDSVLREEAGATTWPPGSGPVARDGSGARVGEFAYAVLEDPSDFALVRLDGGVQADPQMCHFGGPTAINGDRPSSPVLLQHYGNGVAVGAVLPARTAVALGMPDHEHVFAQGIAVPGDSGSGVTSRDGRAVGVLVTLGVHVGTGSLLDAGVIGITRLGPQLSEAEDALGMDLTLRTAPTL